MIAAMRIGISKVVKNAEAVAPKVPNVEINANPTGPQLQAPAIVPINELKTPVPIFPLDLLKILIR